jgi:HAMP domain-containing protein
MDPWILKAIAAFAAVLIVDAILFVTARRRNRRMRVIRVERIITRGWREGDDR